MSNTSSRYDRGLYDALSELRFHLARQAGRPAFAVFHNRALVHMAEVLPGTKETFLKIEGVGPVKWEKYGQLFLDLIIRYCSEKGLTHGDVIQKSQKVDKKEIIQRSGELAALLETIYDFYERRDWEKFHSPKNLVMTLASEVGELVDPFRWLTEEQSYRLDAKTLEEVRDEIGDVFIVLIYLASKLGIDPIAAASNKLAKLEQKYPEEACYGKSSKYTAYETSIKEPSSN